MDGRRDSKLPNILLQEPAHLAAKLAQPGRPSRYREEASQRPNADPGILQS